MSYFSSFSGVYFKVPNLSRICRIHLQWIMPWSSQMPSSGPTQLSSSCGDSDCCWLTAVSLTRNCPWLQEIASLKVTPLPEDSLEPVISWCGERQAPLPKFGTNLKSHPSPTALKVQPRPQSAPRVSFSRPVLPPSLSHKSLSQDHLPINLLKQLSQSLLQKSQFKILRLSALFEKFTIQLPDSMLLTCQNQGEQLNDFIHKLSCKAVLSGAEDKLHSYSS